MTLPLPLSSLFDPVLSRLHVLEQRVVHVNSATRQLDSAICRLSFLVLFSPFYSVLRLSVHASRSIVYSKIQIVTHHYQRFSCSQYLLLVQVQAQQKYLNALT
ncbi:hypothetical protein H5410_045982 [Solanum commersonii]|uniref:Uncharacterized protein n=1 Tax=Solanum commersonii TaxID=4109 RepID=A0A9J5XEA1_SOLCO|nr:hypothetical protein H5410_045982 [Solanum commersonii]